MRTPAYSFLRAGKHTLEYLIQEHYFQQALRLSNPAILSLLEEAGYDLAALKPRLRLSLHNYSNRMHFRSVPFGLFSGFSVLRWSNAGLAPGSIQLSTGNLHLLPDFEKSYREQVTDREQPNRHTRYYKNPTLYRTGKYYRYLIPHIVPDHSALSFSLAAAARTPILEQVFVTEPALPLADWETQILQQPDLTPDYAAWYLQELILSGILLPEIPLQKLGFTGKQLHITVKDLLLGIHAPEGSVLSKPPYQGTVYANLERSVVQGSLAVGLQQNLKDGLVVLQKLAPATGIPDALRKFRKDFETRFEERFMPLLQVMDPEQGLGYARLESSANEPVGLVGLPLSEPQPAYKKIHWTPAHSLLQKYMQEATELQTKGIELRPEDVASLPDREDVLPPGISVMFRTMGQQVYIEAAGGATATALSGRFSLFQDDIKKTLQKLARQEMEANPDVVFAEIESVQDLHVANVERRAAFYDYKIPILTDAGTEGDPVTLPLSDLWVGIRAGAILLWSRQLDKEVIPRLSTAFNYQHSPLSVYRFLCDMQHQYIRSNFHLDLSLYFPYLSFYPRLSYGKTLLSLATWIFKKADFKDIARISDAPKQAGQLQTLLHLKGCPHWVALTEGDQQLVYDLRDTEDCLQLWANINTKEEVTLQEFPFTQSDALVVDAAKQPYLAQYIACLGHTRKVYPKRIGSLKHLHRLYHRKRTDEHWLYLKLYLHPTEANALLLNYLRTFIQKQKADQQIGLWFFVRYADPDFHIRLRIYCTVPSQKAAIWEALQQLLRTPTERRVLRAIASDLYQQELERYYPAPIKAIEQLFAADSDWVLSLLRNSLPEAEMAITQPFVSAALIIDSLLPGIAEKIAFCTETFESLLREHHGDKRSRKALADLYDSHIRNLSAKTMYLPMAQRPEFCIFRDKAKKLRPKLSRRDDRIRICAALVHMHLNRYFMERPRAQEMMVCYMLMRFYKAQEGRG